MKAVSALFPIFLLQSPGEARHVEQRVELAGAQSISIECVAGEVRIEGADVSDISLRADLYGAKTELKVSRVGGRIAISVEGEGPLVSAELLVIVPRKLEVEAKVVSAELGAVHLDAKVALVSVSGELVGEDLRGEVQLRTTSGDVKLRGSTERVSVETVSGAAALSLNRAALALTTVSGDVVIDAEELIKLSAETISGDVQLNAALAPQGSHRIVTQSGDVGLNLTRGGAELRFDSMSGELSGARGKPQSSGSWPPRSRTLTVGAGGPSLSVSTMSGDLEVN